MKLGELIKKEINDFEEFGEEELEKKIIDAEIKLQLYTLPFWIEKVTKFIKDSITEKKYIEDGDFYRFDYKMAIHDSRVNGLVYDTNPVTNEFKCMFDPELYEILKKRDVIQEDTYRTDYFALFHLGSKLELLQTNYHWFSGKPTERTYKHQLLPSQKFERFMRLACEEFKKEDIQCKFFFCSSNKEVEITNGVNETSFITYSYFGNYEFEDIENYEFEVRYRYSDIVCKLYIKK